MRSQAWFVAENEKAADDHRASAEFWASLDDHKHSEKGEDTCDAEARRTASKRGRCIPMDEAQPLVEEQLTWSMDDRVAHVLREWDFAFTPDDDRERIARVVLNMGGVPDLLAALAAFVPRGQDSPTSED